MPVQPFSIARLPRIEFGGGAVRRLPELIGRYGRQLLLVTGARSFPDSAHWEPLLTGLQQAGLSWTHVIVHGEPSPSLIDETVARLQGAAIEVVVGIGGGSALDTAKAVAGLLPSGDSVLYLEGVGSERPYQGPALPTIAVPTTAGTGSEATPNAVLSVPGKDGLKTSLRHELLVPQYALLDPDLLASCAPEQIAANAMNALTQLLDAYVSSQANPFTDGLALSGLEDVCQGLFAWYENEGAAEGRALLACAAFKSGICLAQTGLGSVHGLVAPLGAFFSIPHAVICGTLIAGATRTNIDALREREPDSPIRDKYARVGNLLGSRQHNNPRNAREALVLTLTEWTERLKLPRLSAYGVGEADLARIVAQSRSDSTKANPIALTDEEITEILRQRL